jgi:hypothetical protein
MNKLLLTTLGFLAALSAYAQGTFNASNNYIPTGQTAKAFILDSAGLPLAKANGRVEILNAADQASLSPGGSAGVALSLDGLFFINNLVVPGVATGGTAPIVVRAWDSTTGATFAEATSKISGLVTVSSLGGGTTPAATFGANSNFIGLQLAGGPVIPEPSTVALAALGVAGLFFVARRKS